MIDRLCLLSLILLTVLVTDASGQQRQPAVAPQQPGNSSFVSQWRRTRTGWETRDQWVTTPQHVYDEYPSFPLHPTTVALFQILVSVGALVAFSQPKRHHPVPQSAASSAA